MGFRSSFPDGAQNLKDFQRRIQPPHVVRVFVWYRTRNNQSTPDSNGPSNYELHGNYIPPTPDRQ
ncbi:hypothetical protein ACLOJK_012654 [Asimina triloba]